MNILDDAIFILNTSLMLFIILNIPCRATQIDAVGILSINLATSAVPSYYSYLFRYLICDFVIFFYYTYSIIKLVTIYSRSRLYNPQFLNKSRRNCQNNVPTYHPNSTLLGTT